MTMLAAMARRLAEHGDREALVIDEGRLTYAELADRVASEQRVLAGLGLVAGSRLGVLMPNSAQLVTSLLAAWSRGVVVVPMNTRYRPDELRYVVEHSEIDVLMTTTAAAGAPDLLARVDEAAAALGTGESAPRLRSVVTRAGDTVGAPPVRVESLGTPAGPYAGAHRDRELLLIYTSGTTAHPKGCVHDIDAFLTTARHTAATMGVRAGDVVWDPLPFFHTGGLLPMLGSLDAGAVFCSGARFDAEPALALLERERVTAAYPAFSTLLTALLDAPSFPRRDLSSLRWILAIGAQSLLERVQKAIPSAVQVSCYGCTEMGGVAVYNDVADDATRRATTSGRPFPGLEVRVVGADGVPVAGGERGEIEVRGASVLRRYHGEPALPVDGEGWLRTGDLGAWDGPDLVFAGRLKDVFKVGGENVGAAEIEYVVLRHPAVTMAAAVPMPDARMGEVPAVFVEVKPGHSVEEAELIAFCAERLAAFKVPRVVRFVDEWPMSATKIQKFRLREQLAEGGALRGAAS